MMNNAVYDDKGIIGYRCYQCDKVVSTMWENTCNQCEEKNSEKEEIQALENKVKELTEKLAKTGRN